MQRDSFVVHADGQNITLHKLDFTVRPESELNSEEKSICDETHSLIYANLYLYEYDELGLPELYPESAYRVLDVSVRLLLEDKLSFDELHFDEDDFWIVTGDRSSGKVHMEGGGLETYDYPDAEKIVLELQAQLVDMGKN